jgi:molecular chaperone DnaK
MSNNKRKRAVILALIAFFCGATAFVSVDWKRFGGGFLAFLKSKGDPVVAYAGRGTPTGGGILTAAGETPAGPALPPRLAGPAASHRKNTLAGGAGGRLPDDDLFKYGEPAAGAIPPGSFLVASNDTSGGGSGSADAAGPVGGLSAAGTDGGPSSGGEAGGGSGVGSPAPAPTGGNGGFGDGGVIGKSPAPTPAPATPPPSPGGTPPAPAPTPASTPDAPAPAPAPTQSGTSDQNPGPGGGGTPPVDTPPPVDTSPPVAPTPPVSAVPEASESAMMGLGLLFLAVAATRRRNNG